MEGWTCKRTTIDTERDYKEITGNFDCVVPQTLELLKDPLEFPFLFGQQKAAAPINSWLHLPRDAQCLPQAWDIVGAQRALTEGEGRQKGLNPALPPLPLTSHRHIGIIHGLDEGQ